MHLQPYLKRIGYRGDVRPDHAVLVALQRSHVCSVAFENLDVQLGNPVTISAQAAYEKIVINGRGGWCYEQNGLFGWALSEIGFNVTRVAAAVMRQGRGDASLANHLCLLVNTPESPQRYLVDVGFGGSMLVPIELLDGEYAQAPFRLGLKKNEDGYWRFWEDLGGGRFSFDFLDEPADEAALQAKCAILQSDPSSNFVLNLVAQLRTRDRHKVLRGRVLRIATATEVSEHMLHSADELVGTLATQFHLHLPEATKLWPKVMARHEDILHAKSDVRGS